MGTRDRRKSTERSACKARISYPSKIPGARIGTRLGEKYRGRGEEGRAKQR